MKKGTVMAISRWRTTVFTDDCQLVKVRTRPDLSLGQEIRLDERAANGKETKPIGASTAPRRLAPAMAAVSLFLVIAISILFSQGLIFNPVYAQISVDVNPSVEFSLNRNLDVIGVRAMNPDATELLDAKRYQGLPWQTALEQWIGDLQLKQQIQVQNMLISAVMPDAATQLRTRLMSLEGTEHQGIMSGINVRVIFSHDQAVSRQARRNDLSIGRQMLLNQARLQNKDLNESSIEEAPLDELIRTLLQEGQPDQTRLTERTTQSLSDPTDQSQGSDTQATSRETQRETHRETSGSTQATSDGSQQTHRETQRETSRETSSSSQGSSNGATQGSGSHESTGGTQDNQQTSQEGSQQTSIASQSSQQANQESSQQTSQEGSQQTSSTSQPSQQTIQEGSQQTSDTTQGSQQTSGTSQPSQQTSQEGSQQTSSSSQGGSNGG